MLQLIEGDEPCSHCMGAEPPEGSDPRKLNPLKYCNPNFCDLARWVEGQKEAANP